jgi:hypothetical protein
MHASDFQFHKTGVMPCSHTSAVRWHFWLPGNRFRPSNIVCLFLEACCHPTLVVAGDGKHIPTLILYILRMFFRGALYCSLTSSIPLFGISLGTLRFGAP